MPPLATRSIRAPTESNGVIASAALAAASVHGLTGAFGLLSEHLSGALGGPAGAAAAFGLAGGLQAAAGPAAGRALRRWGPGRLVQAAACALVAGLVGAAVAPAPALAILVYGLCVGLAAASTMTPMLATAASAGSGQTSWPVAIVSFSAAGGAVLVVAGLAVTRPLGDGPTAVIGLAGILALLLVAGARGLSTAECDAPKTAPPPSTDTVRELAGDPAVRRFYLSGVLAGAVAFVPAAALVPTALHWGLDGWWTAALTLTLACCNVAGRLAAGAVSPMSSASAFRWSHVAMAAGFFAWAAVEASAPSARGPLLLAVTVVVGLTVGGWATLAPATITAWAPAARLPEVLAVLFTAPGVGVLVGPPLLIAVGQVHGHATSAVVAATVALFAAVVLPLLGPERRT